MEASNKFKETEIGKIPEEWEIKPVSEVVNIIGGGTPKTSVKEYWDGDIPWISVVDFVGNKRWIHDTEKKITEKGLHESSTKLLSKGQLIISARGTVGELGQLAKDMVFNQSCYGIDAKDKTINDFLYYLLRYSIKDVQSKTHGSVFNTITRETFKQVLVALPNIVEQKAISKILSDLDSKIELNIEMNKTLESIGQALFKRWFVDFEFPNENGKPYKSSGGEMVDSELGEIPKGWTVSKLGDRGTFKNGINYLRNETGDTDFFIANVRDIANNKLLLKEFLDKIRINAGKAKDYLLHEKDILIARSASPGEISLVLGDLKKVIYSGFSIRYRLNNPANYLYIFHVMLGSKKNLQNYSIGTTLQSVNQEILKNMRFILPSDETLNKFNMISKQILDKILNNLLQNRELSTIRDSLLPRLMSGCIRVPMGGDN